MAATSGRKLVIRRGGTDGTVIAALRTKGVTINREPIDITSDDDDGWRLLLADPATKSVDLSFDGVTKNKVLLAAIMASEPQSFEDIEVEFTDTGDTLHGDFFFNNLTLNGPYNDAGNFSGSLQSSGPIVYAAGA